MIKLLVFISGILISAAFSLKGVMSSEYMVYSSPAIENSPPTKSPQKVAGVQTSVKKKSEHFIGAKDIEVVTATVIDVVDTDMIRVLYKNQQIDVHVIGVEPPSDEQLRNYFKTHRQKIIDTIKAMIEGKTIYLVKEGPSHEVEVEPWERYIFLQDMTFLNTELLHKGLAVHTNLNSTQYQKSFSEAQTHAQLNQKGIWNSPTRAPIFTPTLPPSKKLAVLPSTLPTLTPTLLPTQTPTSTPYPTILPSASSQQPVLPTLQPHSTAAPDSLDAEKLFRLINEHRSTKNLTPLEKHDYLCNVAKNRAPQLYDEIFITKNVHAGFYEMNLPYWITENMAHYDSEDIIMQWWLNSTIHRNAIEGNHRYTCGACHGKSCVQLFTSFVKK